MVLNIAKAIPGVGNILSLVESLTGTLKTVGIIRTPEDEIKAKQALAEIVTQQWQNITDFVRATTPDTARVYVWVNSLIALIRPGVTILLVLFIITHPEARIDVSDARLWPVLWWFFGPEVLRLFGLRAPNGGGIVRGGSAHLDRPEPREPFRGPRDRERE